MLGKAKRRKSSRPKKNKKQENHVKFFKLYLLIHVDKLTPVQGIIQLKHSKKSQKKMGIDLDFEKLRKAGSYLCKYLLKVAKTLVQSAEDRHSMLFSILANLVVNKENGGYTRVVMDMRITELRENRLL